VIVHLTDGELRAAAFLGGRRDEASRARGLKAGHGFGAESNTDAAAAIDILGAEGEYAVAKALGLPMPDTVNTFKLPDLPGRLQVRASNHPKCHLLVRPKDADGDNFILVQALGGGRYDVLGWLPGRAAKRREFEYAKNGRPPVYLVPRGKLRAVDDLRPKQQRQVPAAAGRVARDLSADEISW